ncbi:MAG: S8 family serine peptidase [Bacteroidetes bacterium]|nr:S8 family serine peptidase [Bacteroidota bacterium]
MHHRLIFLSVILTSILISQQSFTPRIDPQRPVRSSAMPVIPADSIVSVIVEFRELPLFLTQQNSAGNAPLPDYRQRFTQFLQDLRSASATASVSPSAPVTVRREFTSVFFGMSAEMPYGLSVAAAALPYVKKVHRTRPVRATLHKSIPQIRANEIWTNLGVRGEGVTVGIIDTGIDYLHPALGGAFGAGAKVVGGYDFYNGDNDPMDDNGHGTHVAGIVAADAADVKGVAPKAKLYAFKVLGAEGGGSMDDIIAAVERCVDPNNDGNMNDRLDIVNMSLGADGGEPDDAPSVAVDNATALGVTFVIAAGNSGYAESFPGKDGNYYYSGLETIGSPGTSRRAITVGAIDSVNNLAYFSSKGPTPGEYGIKPDVVAPGVNIRSLFPGNGMLVESGTSMASPMVAGVAALLKSIDPALTPAQIKSKLVNGAVDLGMKPVHQGAGRVDAVRAAALSATAEPVHLSFGLDDPAMTTWTSVETVKVTNRKNVAQNFSATFTGGAAGVTVSAAPSNFTVAAGGTQTVLVTISVNNAVIPIVDGDIILYSGVMQLKSAADTLRLPWMFSRTTRMLLTFSHPHAYFLGVSENSYFAPYYDKMFSRVRQLDPLTWEVTGPAIEPYDFGVHFRDQSALVLKTGNVFDGAETFAFNAAEALHTVTFGGVDQDNVPFSSLSGMRRSLRVAMPKGIMFASLPAGTATIIVSPVGNDFQFHPTQVQIDLKSAKRVVLPQYPVFTGMSGNVTVSNPPAGFVHQKLRFIMPDGVTATRFFTEVIAMELSGGEYYYNTSIVGADTINVPTGDHTVDLFLMPGADPVHSASVAFHTNSSYDKNTYLDMSTRYLSVVNDSLMLGLPSQRLATSYLSPAGATLTFGDAPVFVTNLSYNNSFGPSIHFNPIYFGSLFEFRYADVNTGHYAIYDDAGVLLKESPLNDFPRDPFPAELKRHTLVLTTHGYRVRKAMGTLTLRNEVDLSKPNADAPIFTSLMVRNSAGTASSGLTKGDQATLRFSSKVLTFPSQLPVHDSTRVWYKKFRSTVWIPLPATLISAVADKDGAVYTVPLAAATAEDSTGIDLRIRTVDENGNAAVMTLSPAFSVGNWQDDGTTDIPEEGAVVPLRFALEQNFPNPFNPITTIRYHVPAAGEVRLAVFDLLGREVALLTEGVRAAGSYTASFNAAHLSSGVYLYRLTAGGMTNVRKMMLVK